LLITGVPLAITKLAVWLVTPKALLAVSVAVLVPEVVGVPVINPLVAMERPVGRLDPVNVIGAVPLAVTVLLNATPTVPLKELVEVMTGALVPAAVKRIFRSKALLVLALSKRRNWAIIFQPCDVIRA